MVYVDNKTYKYDFFISHASEDKEDLVRPLVEACKNSALKIWFDNEQIEWGDNLRKSIDEGL